MTMPADPIKPARLVRNSGSRAQPLYPATRLLKGAVLEADRIAPLFSQVMKPARPYHRVKIHLHPDDVDRVRADQPRLAKQLAFVRDLQFCPDADLPPHGVRVETEMGSYLGTVDTQIRKLQ